VHSLGVPAPNFGLLWGLPTYSSAAHWITADTWGGNSVSTSGFSVSSSARLVTNPSLIIVVAPRNWTCAVFLFDVAKFLFLATQKIGPPQRNRLLVRKIATSSAACVCLGGPLLAMMRRKETDGGIYCEWGRYLAQIYRAKDLAG